MKNEKHLEQANSKEIKKDAIIRRYYAESKIHKLIDRMCNGESINATQFDQIFDYIKRKGHRSTIQEEWHIPVWGETGISYHRKEIREKTGIRFLGIFAAEDDHGDRELHYGDTRKSCIATMKRDRDGRLFVNR